MRDPNKEFLNGLQRSATAGSRQGSRVQRLLPMVEDLLDVATIIINQASVTSQSNEQGAGPSQADVVPDVNSNPVQQAQSATAT